MVIPSYTSCMKTAISMTDETFQRAEEAARRLGMNRSQFISVAVARYADELESSDITDAINAVVDRAGMDDASEFAVAAAAVMDVDEW